MIIDQDFILMGDYRITMKLFLLIGMVMVLSSGPIISNVTAAIPQTSRHCTSTYPCDYKVCGDHICASGEYDQLRTQVIQAQRGTTGITGMTSGNMTTTNQSTGTVVGGVVSYVDQASDGTIVLIRTSHSVSGQPLALGIGFFTANRNAIQHQNYAIAVSQDNASVLSNLNGHTHTGIDTMTTMPLLSSHPINVEVTLNGVGLPTADPSTWTGVKGEVLNFLQGPEDTMTATPVGTTVPEFGPVASIVLAIAVLSVVVVAAKSRVIPRL